jgi:hypothetical protein
MSDGIPEGFKPLTRSTWKEDLLPIMTLNNRNLAYANEAAATLLKQTSEKVFDWALLFEIEEGVTAGVRAWPEQVAGAIQVHWGTLSTNAKLALGPLTQRHPALKPEKGYLRLIPVSVKKLKGLPTLRLHFGLSIVAKRGDREAMLTVHERLQAFLAMEAAAELPGKRTGAAQEP